ncbi:DNA mismatch repair protein Mlh1 OS=Mus musculus GN=Mlh1 PE=2 SV=2 [Rhizoctonia solani AG-1 IB]|uniref:DNA mismatch repair protein Mlh1 n=1 Tax=Thanatephorus cucumeris (strain AG1-IB / isolate 7/3/14) TaxID=1108050 RepID=A0A0B7G2C7_THACB|nr:DNA mismatch repair protein Mlh1 OS=Mus musculus GN=Mlh1 PE=2 SV=2 [Rhizoctonia solani AG-1 IB]
MSLVSKTLVENTSNTESVPVIKRLDETLVNRIAAGEIIHRPSSALKELIENALDAGATSIKITAKDGGMKLLQIQDNGCGIRKSDLPILCERFTTSKLRDFSDLQDIATYGFRGEALASISFVSHLSVVTKTRSDACAWRALYEDGIMIAPKEGAAAEPVACAGNDGTVITAEDLFYNTPVRKSSLRNQGEEYARLSDVVTRYAIHQAGVSFVCKKAGATSPDVSTPVGASRSSLIRLLFGATVAEALFDVEISSSSVSEKATGKRKRPKGDVDTIEESWSESDEEAVPVGERDEKTKWKANAVFTSTSYHGKKLVMLLFINHRLVESRRIQRGIEAVYSTIMPKGAHPFVYLSLEIDPKHVDVNVHPTKREVHFLNEDVIVETISDAIQEKLAVQSSHRTFKYQTLTPITDANSKISFPKASTSTKASKARLASALSDDEDEESSRAASVTPAPKQPPKSLPQHLVRTSLRDRTLDSMFATSSGSSSPAQTNHKTARQLASSSALSDDPSTTKSVGSLVKSSSKSSSSKEQTLGEGLNEDDVLRDSIANMVMNDRDQEEDAPSIVNIPESECFLTSVLELRQQIQDDKHSRLTDILRNSKFVGMVDVTSTRSLFQHELKLYLVNHSAVAEELFYQLGLRQFGNFSTLKLSPPPPLHELVHLAVNDDIDIQKAGLDPEKIGDKIIRILTNRREMLEEYFGIQISEDGLVQSLPLLLPGYTPNIDLLPVFLMHLGPRVDWKSEKNCFDTVFREIARFYTSKPPLDLDQGDGEQTPSEERDAAVKAMTWQNTHIIFPAVQKYLVAPKRLIDKDVAQIANLPDLYRVFERC